jgi:hypothetical protein
LNRRTFNASIFSFNNQLPMTLLQLNPLILACNNQKQAVKDAEVVLGDTMGDVSQNFADDHSDDDETQSQPGCNAVTQDGKLTYQSVAEKATNLVRLAQTDQATLGLLCNLLD